MQTEHSVGTDKSFQEILGDSMRFYAHVPRRVQTILNVQPYRAICQLFPEGFNLLSCIYEPESPQLFQN